MRQKPCVDGERRCAQRRPDKPTVKSQSGGRIEASRMEHGQKGYNRLGNAFQQRA